MIRHMVLFNLKDDIDDSDRAQLFAQIRGMSAIPSVRRIETGTLLDPTEASYRSHMSSDFSCALLADFENEEALYAYQKHPMHVSVAAEIRKRVSLIKVIDFVISD
jgi:Stress responsive A/B Barrel Domain